MLVLVRPVIDLALMALDTRSDTIDWIGDYMEGKSLWRERSEASACQRGLQTTAKPFQASAALPPKSVQ